MYPVCCNNNELGLLLRNQIKYLFLRSGVFENVYEKGGAHLWLISGYSENLDISYYFVMICLVRMYFWGVNDIY